MRHRLADDQPRRVRALCCSRSSAPLLWKYSYASRTPAATAATCAERRPPARAPTQLAADMLAQVLRGTQFSLPIALVGGDRLDDVGRGDRRLAGYLRGWVDSADAAGSRPVAGHPAASCWSACWPATSALATGGGGGNWYIVALFLGLFSWMQIARIIRGDDAVAVGEKEFVEAARALGGGAGRIVFRHILPEHDRTSSP